MLCVVFIVEPVCVLAASAAAAATSLCFDWGLLSAPILGESENGCLHTLLTLFELLEDSLDQLLIKAITKLCEKKVASV